MHLRTRSFFVQKEELKKLDKFPLVHSEYMDVLAEVWKHVDKFLVQFQVHKFEGKCQCKSAAAKIILLRNDRGNLLVFKKTFIICFRREYVKKRYALWKRRLISQ